jgi:hypothetical protein
MSDLVEFLLARIAEDCAWAKRQERIAIRTHHVGRRGPYPPDHFSRVLADCEAKRQIMSLCEDIDDGWAVLARLALSYADHPDYREEWRP